MVALLALTSASALAATSISVTETTDAPLESGASTCESTDVAKGCTLRAAVELADVDGGTVTIDVPAGTYKETVTEPTLVVEDAEVTISGAGAGKTIIEGEAKGRVLEVEEDCLLTLDGVTVTQGDAGNGAGIFVLPFAGLIVESSTITENTAGEDGGGIYSEEAEVTVEDSTIAHNDGHYHGGAIYAEGGELTIKGSTIAANTSEYDGGGISADRTFVTIEEQSTITENETMHSEGGGIATFRESGRGEDEDCEEVYGQLTIEQSTISDNRAAVDDEGNGGGIYAETFADGCDERVRGGVSERHAATPLRSTRSAHHGLRATALDAPEDGGGLTVEQSTIAGNEAGYYGGGIDESGGEDPIINSTIADNTAGYEGGGVFAEREDFATLISDTVADNQTGAQHIGNNLGAEDLSAIYLRNTIVAEEPGEYEENCEGEIESFEPGAGYNLDYPSKARFDSATDSCGLSEADQDLVGVAPEFEGGLRDNGGPTETIALAALSPAIGVVPLAGDCEEPSPEGPGSVDQRGVKRPGIPGKGCDIGAYEYQKEAAKVVEAKQEATAMTSVLPFKSSTPAPQCASLRDITIHIQNVKQLGIVSAVVSIDGHDRRTLRGKHLRTAINLRGLPKGTFTVEIVARTRGGRTLKGKRVYHTCHNKLPGHSYLPL